MVYAKQIFDKDIEIALINKIIQDIFELYKSIFYKTKDLIKI